MAAFLDRGGAFRPEHDVLDPVARPHFAEALATGVGPDFDLCRRRTLGMILDGYAALAG
ncbi:hypothetical protein ACIQBJ_04240 [Kitasatospora sp. NPDC088391]|uniref:hypothetical protein n=1 Tax=Kitasatospora sp. NPDC088391 TaxID=3364074 RepID=UPI003820AD37